MQGFDSKFKTFPDYILGITHEIWEQRGVETLNHYYADDIVVRSPSSVVVGNQAVIKATYATLDEFPDRQLLGEDVIWSGTPADGMLSSHRILSTATHTGDGAFGKATGTKLVYRVMADCHAINNQINDEWLIRDLGAIVQQLGWTPADYARQQIQDEGGPDACIKPFTPATDIVGPYQGTGNDDEWGQAYAAILTSLMAGDSSVVNARYDRAAQAAYPLYQTAHGYADITTFWQGLRASFPSAEFTIHHQIGRTDPLMPPRAALRWSLSGRHDGQGRFGAPSGADVHIMGISHAEFGPWGLRCEYTLIDDVAVWKQIHLHTGSL